MVLIPMDAPGVEYVLCVRESECVSVGFRVCLRVYVRVRVLAFACVPGGVKEWCVLFVLLSVSGVRSFFLVLRAVPSLFCLSV